jgi:FkbM family methyltransferase
MLDEKEWATLSVFDIGPEHLRLDEATGIAELVKPFERGTLALRFSLAQHRFLLNRRCLSWLYALQAEHAQFELDQRQRLLLTVDGIRCFIEGEEDLFIVDEIFAQKVYRFQTRSPVIVWDIGMNVGVASLFFAQQPNVVAVHGFEPFLPTYRQAAENFSLNPALSGKIRPYNHGLGARDGTMSAIYSYEHKGSSGTHSRTARVADAGQLETVKLRNAGEVLEEIISQHPGKQIAAKVDCEGAEYEILECLAASGGLKSLSSLMIEWHDLGPEKLLKYLTELGFVSFAIDDPASYFTPDVSGRIYAVRAA